MNARMLYHYSLFRYFTKFFWHDIQPKEHDHDKRIWRNITTLPFISFNTYFAAFMESSQRLTMPSVTRFHSHVSTFDPKHFNFSRGQHGVTKNVLYNKSCYIIRGPDMACPLFAKTAFYETIRMVKIKPTFEEFS